MFNLGGFVIPIFKCPIRKITSKIDGINSYKSDPLHGIDQAYCPTDLTNFTSELDPTLVVGTDCSELQSRTAFSQCKNDCPGVGAYGIIGGGAVLGVAAASAGIGSITPAFAGLAGLGIAGGGVAAGAGAVMMMQEMEESCTLPFCRADNGQCCLLIMGLNGISCPQSC